jgi:protein involved in polysaccharide export with SLBB domain
MAAIAGNVRRPALYELEDNTSLNDCIELAGGLTPNAWVNRIQVERFQKNDRQIVLDINVESPGTVPAFPVQDGDVIKIFPVVHLDRNAVYLSGNVYRPGKYEYTDGMKISDIISSSDQILPEAYFNYAVIRRQEPPSYEERILSFNLESVLADKNCPDNLSLKALDQIIVYNQDFFEPSRNVTIDGAVTKPGTYKLLKNMRIKDLILEAGGLNEHASFERGELYKRIYDRDSVLTQKIAFSIDAVMKDDPQENILLCKNDRVFIRQKQGWEDQKSITLIGEFTYPGTYIVLEGESLGSIIRRAGGFKPDAYLAAAIFTRESVRKLEVKRTQDYLNQLEMDIATITSEMASKGNVGDEMQAMLSQQRMLLEKLRTIEHHGRVVIDFEDEKNFSELQVEDGDMLFVPKDNSTVAVLGEVFNPSTFVLEKKMPEVRHYVQLAGGFKEDANKKNVYVIKANGSVRTKKMERIPRYSLEPGDAIVVPRKIPFNSGRTKIFLGTIESVLAITSQSLLIATSILTIQRL